jgi:hemolysin III
MQTRDDDAMPTARWTFPSYTAAETTADRALHLLAVPAAIGAFGWLILTTAATADIGKIVAQDVYGIALIGMLSASAAYNLSRASRTKELLRRLDRAMIFVMIAGTYTPFILFAFPQRGPVLCLPVWSLAAIGIALTVAFPRRCELLLLALYLGMGWMVLGMGRGIFDHLPNPVLSLLLAGGVAYSVGAIIHARGRLPFHNVIWHALVVLGAGLHWAAIARLLAPPGSSLAMLLG